MRSLQRTCLVLSVLGMLPETVARAGVIVAGQDTVPSVAVQSVELFPGTPFNPGSTPLTVQLTGTGSFVLDRGCRAGAPSTSPFPWPISWAHCRVPCRPCGSTWRPEFPA